MLTTVPENINDMARSVLEFHPNTFNCEVYRKTVNRTEANTVGGLPTLGGLGVLDSEDEENISFTWLGNGYAMQAEPFQSSAMMDRQDANNSYAVEIKFLIAPEKGQDFDIKKHDVIYLLIGDTVKMAWEIVGVETILNIPPFSLRYVMNRRDDLDM